VQNVERPWCILKPIGRITARFAVGREDLGRTPYTPVAGSCSFVTIASSLLATRTGTVTAQEADAPPRQTWSFHRPLGRYDTAQLQRGFKIYREVCSNCHSMKLLAFRNIADPGGPGFSEAQAGTVASGFQVTDGPNDQGEMFQRQGKLADRFPPPFPNDQAARAAMSGGLPPDMSVLAIARS
jgi:cytochrome c1